jgi:2-polyprenyl-3-methyl-5-hydroxy-6-metoxy-1,4-benzoquinol methylase
MAWTFPAAWEEKLWQAAPRVDRRALLAAIAERTLRYTSERQRLHAPMPASQVPADVAARAVFFGVADAAKIAIPVAELAGRGLLPTSDPLRVLDVGAGCGAMTFGLAAALPERRLDVVALDLDAPALAVARAVAALTPSLTLRTLTADLAAAPEGPFDLVVAGTVLNELPADRRLDAVRWLLARTTPAGAVILVEPALRETSRALHELRDDLRTAGVPVFAPCTRTAARCPALDDPDDWCHEDRVFQPPPRLAELSRATGLRAGGLKFSYLTLRHDDAPLVPVRPGQAALRVVSDPLDQKGIRERWVCGETGRHKMRVLKRERSEAFADSRRGDVLVSTPDAPLALHRPGDP